MKCLFCRWDDPVLNEIVYESENFYARYDNFPAVPGHTEVVPKRHVESFFDLRDYEIVEAYILMKTVETIIAWKFPKPDGYTIGVNEGKAAGRSVDHLHIHMIPRYYGDVENPRGGIRQCTPNRWNELFK